MKQTFLSLFAILLLAVQGFAGPVDSLSVITIGQNITGERGELNYYDDGVEPSAAGGTTSSSLTATPTSRTVYDVLVGSSKKVTFKLTGKNLTKPITLSTIAEPTGGEFKVYPETLPASGGTVTVTVTPETAGSTSAVITYKSGNNVVKLKVTAYVKSVIKTNKSSIHFAEAGAQSLTVTCVGANSDLTLTPQGTGKQYFKFVRTISRSDARKGKTITVTCTAPISLQRATAQIQISGGGANPKTVYLTYVKGQDVRISEVKPDDEPDDAINGGEIEAAVDTWSNSVTAVNELSADFSISAEGQNIVIESTVAQSAMISDIAGRARSVNLQPGRNVIPVNTNGVYIVRAGEKTAKLMIK